MNFFQNLSVNFLVTTILFIAYSIIIAKFSIIFSKKLNLIDYPDQKRKIHKKPVPLIGFSYFLMTFLILFSWSLFENNFSLSFSFAFIFALLFNSIIGLVDDKSNLSPNSRIYLITIISHCL